MKKISWPFYLTLLFCLYLFFTSIGKFSGAMQEEIPVGVPLANWVYLVGIGEIIATLLFLLEKTKTLGTFLLAAYFGGAIVFHLMHPVPAHQSVIFPSVLLLVLFLLAFFRNVFTFSTQRIA